WVTRGRAIGRGGGSGGGALVRCRVWVTRGRASGRGALAGPVGAWHAKVGPEPRRAAVGPGLTPRGGPEPWLEADRAGSPWVEGASRGTPPPFPDCGEELRACGNPRRARAARPSGSSRPGS